MRGSLKQRYKGSWSLILDLGYEPDATGIVKRKQKWVSFRGTRKDAEARLVELLTAANGGHVTVDSSKLTLAQWLREWLEASVKPPRCRPATYARYKGIIERDIAPASIGSLPLRKLRPTHLEAYYAAGTVSAATMMIHHAILHRALRKAAKDKLIPVNIATDLDGKPRHVRNVEEARLHCWTAAEARDFLIEAKAAGTQPAAFYTLAIDSGMRKAELCGLQWPDLDLDAGKVRIARQLTKPGAVPTFGPTKTGAARTVTLGAETIMFLRAHRQHQAEMKMANRTVYHDFGLVFAKEWADLQSRGAMLGHPLQMNNLGQREYAKLIKLAKVRPIKFHGLRHTCATLLLQARQPVHVVSERLGHSKVAMTMEVYAHVLPDMQQDAATVLGGLLHR